MTPIEQLIHDAEVQIKEIEKNTYWEQSNSLYPFHSFLKGRVQKYQSLLPVEQQFNCEFAEWVGNKGWYWNIDIQKYKKWEDETRVFATTTELLQLFTNQNQGK